MPSARHTHQHKCGDQQEEGGGDGETERGGEREGERERGRARVRTDGGCFEPLLLEGAAEHPVVVRGQVHCKTANGLTREHGQM